MSQCLKLKSSLVLFGPYDYKCLKATQLKTEFLILLIKSGGDSISLQLSFKHIHRVELLDNTESKGAGLIIHINQFMAQRIQDTIDPKGNDFVTFRTPYEPNNSFIIMDLLNADPQSVENLKRMLQSCDNFHRQYVIEQCNKSRNPADAVQSLPVQYTTIIFFNQWRALLGYLHKDVEFEHVEMVNEMGRPLTYTIGTIVNYSRETFAVRPDSSVVPRRHPNNNNSDDGGGGGGGGGRGRAPPSSSANGRHHQQSPAEATHKSHSNSYHHNPYISYDGVQDSSSRFANRMPSSANSGQQYVQRGLPQQQHQQQPPPPVRFVVQSNRLSHNNPLSQQQHHHHHQNRPQQQQLYANNGGNGGMAAGNNGMNNSLVMDHQYGPSSAAGVSPLQNQQQQSVQQAYGQPSLFNAFVGGAPSSSAGGDGGGGGLGYPPPPPPSPYHHTPRSVLARKAATAAALKREVCVIEDEEDDASADDDNASTSQKKKRKNDTIFVYPPTGSHGCSVHYSDLKYLDHSYMLNDTIIDFYLKFVYHELIPEERRKKIFMFNSFFYSRLSQPPANARPYASASNRWKRVLPNFQFVKSWTKKVNLFDMDYVIVPINEDIHWYLAVILNPKAGIVHGKPTIGDESASVPTTSTANSSIGTASATPTTPTVSATFNTAASGDGDVGGHLSGGGLKTVKLEPTNDQANSSSAGPFVVVFDSLIDGERKHSIVQDILAEYLALEFADKREVMGLAGECFDKASLRLVTPTGTPQQKNYVDCGVFLLKFAEIFMTNPPRIKSTNVSFRSWYPNFQIKGMRDAIKKLIRNMANQIKYADFLPPTPTPTLPVAAGKRRTGTTRDGKKLSNAVPVDILMPPLRTRRHSDSSIWEDTKEKQFTSLGMDSLSQSLDTIISEMRNMPPLVITFPHKKKKPHSSAAAAAAAMAAAGARN